MGLFDTIVDDWLGDPFGTYHQADQARIAGEQQAALADEGVREARRQFNFGRLAMQPFTDAGYEALGVGNYLNRNAIMSGNVPTQAAPGAGLRDKPMMATSPDAFGVEPSYSIDGFPLVPRTNPPDPNRPTSDTGVSRVPPKAFDNPNSPYYDPNWNTPSTLTQTSLQDNEAPSNLRQLGQFGLRSMPGLQDQAARGAAQMGALEEASAAGLRGLSRQEQLAADALASSEGGLDAITGLGRNEMTQQSLDAQRGREAQARQAFRDQTGLGASDRAAAFGAAGLDSRGRVSQLEQIGAEALQAQRSLAGLNGAEAQAAAMADIESDPEYQMLLKQGEEAILQNAAATGGLRGGKTQEALADLRSSLAARQLDKQYSRLGQLAQQGQQASMSGAQMGLGSDQFLSGQGAAASGQLMSQGGAASRGLANMGYGTLQNRYGTGVDLTRNLAGQGLNTAQYMTGLGGNLGQYLASTGASTIGDIARMGQASAAGQASLGQGAGGQVANLLGQKGSALAGGRIAGASGGVNTWNNLMQVGETAARAYGGGGF